MIQPTNLCSVNGCLHFVCFRSQIRRHLGFLYYTLHLLFFYSDFISTLQNGSSILFTADFVQDFENLLRDFVKQWIRITEILLKFTGQLIWKSLDFVGTRILLSTDLVRDFQTSSTMDSISNFCNSNWRMVQIFDYIIAL